MDFNLIENFESIMSKKLDNFCPKIGENWGQNLYFWHENSIN